MEYQNAPERADPHQQLENIKATIREISHEINNPLGVLRMTAYFLERADFSPEKLAEYVGLINQSLDKIETNLHRLNDLRKQSPGSPGR